MKKLYLSKTDKKFAGVFGGFGEYFDIDSTLLRIIWIFVTIFTGFVPGIVMYIFAWLTMPLSYPEPLKTHPTASNGEDSPQSASETTL